MTTRRASSDVFPVPGGPWIRFTVAQSGARAALVALVAFAAAAESPPVAPRTVAVIQSVADSGSAVGAAGAKAGGGSSQVVSRVWEWYQ